MPDLREHLNDQQLAAVTHPGGPMLVAAGAGSGKTRVLTYRLAWLVEQGVAPRNILLMTFTNRAAREMTARVDQLLAGRTQGMTGGTFHHVGNLFLRRFANRLDMEPGFTIIDREDAKQLMRECSEAIRGEEVKGRFPNKGTLVAISGFIQNTLEPLAAVLEEHYPMFLTEATEINQVLQHYQRRKREIQVLDFDDLLSCFHRLLTEHKDVRRLLSERFQHILVDEYQDTNHIQGEIIDRLAETHRNLCVVGDDAQSIYSFRGADFNNIMQFPERYEDAEIFRLERNFRSCPPILELANANIQVNIRRLPKRLVAVREEGQAPNLITCLDGNQQAAVLVGHIEELLKSGLAPEEIAVLYRSHYHSMEVQLQLQRQNIPYQIRGGLRFFEQAHIKDLVAFLRAVHNPCDRTAWLRILPMLPAVGVRTATRICQVLPQERQKLSAALTGRAKEIMPKKARESFVSMTRALQNAIDNWPSPGAVLEGVRRDFYDLYLLSNYETPQRRGEDLQAVINFAEQYSQAEDFLGEIALSTEYSANPEREVEGRAVAANRVVLSTVHQAKGLEWRAVLIPWLVEGRFPASQSLESEAALEEERRIFHVAATRAEDWLIMYVPEAQRTKNNKFFSLQHSRFVDEIPNHLLTKIEARRMAPEECSLFDSARASAGGRDFGEHTQDQETGGWLDDGLPVIWQE